MFFIAFWVFFLIIFVLYLIYDNTIGYNNLQKFPIVTTIYTAGFNQIKQFNPAINFVVVINSDKIA